MYCSPQTNAATKAMESDIQIINFLYSKRYSRYTMRTSIYVNMIMIILVNEYYTKGDPVTKLT